ncbi:MAG: branched-chain amino acid ABC transporter permease [Hyphomicrobiales bacterium]|nr:branched-chain amino acid ABC transporter permease [Hyphomicrobiales bacterium]
MFLIQLLNGLQLGVLLFLVASGLTLVFGIMDFLNLAHGSLYMAGAFFCATFTALTGSFLLGVVLAIPAVALVGLAMELVIARRLYSRGHLDQVLATFGLILIFDTLAHMIWGAQGRSVTLPQWLRGQVVFGGDFGLPSYRVLIVVVGLVVAVLLYWIVNNTKLGMLIRAGASNRTMVSALGVDIRTLFTLVFAIGAVFAGLAGMMVAPITEASIGMGNGIIILAFVVIVIGGLGSVKGAFVAAMLVGIIDTLGRSYLDDAFKFVMTPQNAETSAPAVAAMLIYILMAVILTIRPQGLFPPKVR